MKQVLILFTALFFITAIHAQRGGIIYGKVIEAESGNPAEYAKVILHKLPDSSLVTGVMTDKKGEYLFENVSYGKYYLIADFIGFEKVMKKAVVSPKNSKIELETFSLSPASVDVEEVLVEADYAQVEYKIDKKVVHVSQDLNSASGTAADVLENVPSVQVDIEGNVSLRGSGSFTVLINGKPSILDSNDALQQIPASNIKNIELITNPSAKYDPEGTAGIINIITKKKKDEGFSGVFNAGIGLRNKYKADVNINYKKGGLTLTAGGDYRNDRYHGKRTTERITYGDESDFYYNSVGEGFRERGGMSGNFGIGYDFNKHTSMQANAKYGKFRFAYGRTSEVHTYTQAGNDDAYEISFSNKPRERDYYALTYSFTHKFNFKGHQLDGSMYYSDREGDSELITEEWDTNSDYEKIEESYLLISENEIENSSRLRAKLDYTLPFNGTGKLEAGYQGNLVNETEIFSFKSEYTNPENEGFYFVNDMEFMRNINAAYILASKEFGSVGVQAGIRGEYTDRSVYDKSIEEYHTVQRPDYFPSIHINKEFKGGHKLQAGYSRRIDRPRGYYLEPFTTYIDQYNIRVGNPEIEPEYIDAYEINYQKRFAKNRLAGLGPGTFLSFETFYRQNKNLITHLHTAGEDGIIYHTFANMNSDESLGGELMLNLDFGRKVTVNLSGTVYQYKIDGQVQGEDISNENITWDANSNTIIKFTPTTRFQMRLGYRGPSVRAQGTREGTLFTSAGIRQDLFKRKANITLNVRNLFGTMRREGTIETPDMYEYYLREYEFPSARLNFTFYLNKKPENRKRNGNNGMEDMGE